MNEEAWIQQYMQALGILNHLREQGDNVRKRIPITWYNPDHKSEAEDVIRDCELIYLYITRENKNDN